MPVLVANQAFCWSIWFCITLHSVTAEQECLHDAVVGKCFGHGCWAYFGHGPATCHGLECKCNPGYCSSDGKTCEPEQADNSSSTIEPDNAEPGLPTTTTNIFQQPLPDQDSDFCGIRVYMKKASFHTKVTNCVIQNCSQHIFNQAKLKCCPLECAANILGDELSDGKCRPFIWRSLREYEVFEKLECEMPEAQGQGLNFPARLAATSDSLAITMSLSAILREAERTRATLSTRSGTPLSPGFMAMIGGTVAFFTARAVISRRRSSYVVEQPALLA